jgi:hypothetical protein
MVGSDGRGTDKADTAPLEQLGGHTRLGADHEGICIANVAGRDLTRLDGDDVAERTEYFLRKRDDVIDNNAHPSI